MSADAEKFQTGTDLALEVAALEFRDCSAKIKRKAKEIRWLKGPEKYAAAADKVADDLSNLESDIWKRLNLSA